MDINKNLFGLLENLELRPKMYFIEPSFEQLNSFLFGYILAIDEIYNESINISFSEWLNSGEIKTSLHWSAYILNISANNNKDLAFKLLIKELRNFLSTR